MKYTSLATFTLITIITSLFLPVARTRECVAQEQQKLSLELLPPQGFSAPEQSVIPLTSGVSVSGTISGAFCPPPTNLCCGVLINPQWSITSPSDTTQLTVTITGNGTLDVYVRAGSPVELVSGSVRYDRKGDIVSISPVRAGARYYIAVESCSTLSRTFRLTATLGALSNVSAASFVSTTLAIDSIAAAFGANLTDNTQTASALPLPTTLGGLSVRLRDRAGRERLAPLFFVSPEQINYHVPAEMLRDRTHISVLRGTTEIAAGIKLIQVVEPGLFAANANGHGVAAAVALRVRGEMQTIEPVARFDQAANRFVPVPIDLEPEGDQVFLIAFGTGFRARSALAAVTCTVGGASAAVSFAGAVPEFVGLDQANLLLPRNLAGRGEVNVLLTVNGRTGPPVQIAIK